VIVNAVNPGYCRSELSRNFTLTRATVAYVTERFLAFTSEQGSRQIIYSAVGGEEEKMRGAYISFSEVEELSDYVLSSQEVQNRIWVWLLF
jgi:hypothetical protein